MISNLDIVNGDASLSDIVDQIYHHVGYPEIMNAVCARLLNEVMDLKHQVNNLEDKVLDLERGFE